MKDYLAAIDELRADAAEAVRVRDLANDRTKREMFARLQQHLSNLADEVERTRKVTLKG